MLPLAPKRLVIAKHRVDFRKRFNGLLAESYRARDPSLAAHSETLMAGAAATVDVG